MDSLALITVILAGIAYTQAGDYKTQTYKWNPWNNDGVRNSWYNHGRVNRWAGRQNGDDDDDNDDRFRGNWGWRNHNSWWRNSIWRGNNNMRRVNNNNIWRGNNNLWRVNNNIWWRNNNMRRNNNDDDCQDDDLWETRGSGNARQGNMWNSIWLRYIRWWINNNNNNNRIGYNWVNNKYAWGNNKWRNGWKYDDDDDDNNQRVIQNNVAWRLGNVGKYGKRTYGKSHRKSSY